MSCFSKKYCISCSSSVVCSVLQLLNQNPQLDDAMGSCRYFRLVQGKAVATNIGDEKQPSVDRDEVSRKLREAQEEEEKKEKVLRPSDDLYCHDCGKNNVELLECSKCGELVCADCMTDTIDGRTLCQTCYEAEMPAII